MGKKVKLTDHQKKMADFIKWDGSYETDDTGQIVIYTAMMLDDDDNIVPWEDPDDDDSDKGFRD